MEIVWHWPQILWVSMTAITIFFAIAVDGKPRKGTHSAVIILIGEIIRYYILYCGGFFTVVRP